MEDSIMPDVRCPKCGNTAGCAHRGDTGRNGIDYEDLYTLHCRHCGHDEEMTRQASGPYHGNGKTICPFCGLEYPQGREMNKLAFFILDVFAEKKYAGNQLAVFRNAGSLPPDEMQRIARETNFSETSFILSDDTRAGGYDVRIFTPSEEVPFAGHPTLGTAHVIRNEMLQGNADKVILNLKVGPIPVDFSGDGNGWMRQIEPRFGRIHASETLAAVLGLDAGDLDERFPIQEVSTGLPFFIVPLKTLAALKSAKPDSRLYFELIRTSEAKGILVFCPETHESGNDVSVRVFVECYGIPEDPATGSGNGCLAGYLVKHRYFGCGAVDIRSEQGYEIDRPSLLFLKAEQAGEGIRISVGGRSIVVAEGNFV
jgi:trans-2,3-dihydro-3-hydroxyanthranilate isomerase